MEITISVRHGSLSEAARAKIEAKIAKLGKFFDQLATAEVTVDLEPRENPVLDIKLSTVRKNSFVVREQAGELMASLDASMDKLEQQIKKFKEKLQDRRPE